MNDLLLDDLRDCIARGQVVALIGAGVSIGASDGDPVASWTGLLESGVGHCEAFAGASLTAGWGDRQRAAIGSGDLVELLSAAEQITDKLGGRAGGEYGRWLKESVGRLGVVHRDVLEALHGLGMPLVTTNYDGLVESVTDLDPITWRQGAGRIAPILRGDERAVLHIHGFWQDSESVVLGVRSYDAVRGDPFAQAVLQSLSLEKSWLFVGVGAGLEDPNFGALRSWMKDVLPGSPYRHFRLAHDGELAAVQAEHEQSERVVVVRYGASHADLAAFLRSLAPPEREPSSPARAAAAVAPAAAARLPARPCCFGRDESLRLLTEALLADSPAPVAVLGPPGIGKSNLCLSAVHAADVAERFARRRHFVRCDGSTSAHALLAEVGKTIGLAAGPNLDARVLARLDEAPAALVLDNAETPWEGDTVAVEDLLGAFADLSRLALVVALRGSQRPLGLAWRESVIVTQLAPADARSIFLSVAGERFGSDDHLDGLLAAVDYLPLAIELLAWQAEGEPGLEALARRWSEERVRMLERRAGGERHLSVPASVEVAFSCSRMDDEARSLLSVLALLPDGILHSDLRAAVPDGDRAASTLRKVGLAFDEAGRLRALKPTRDHIADAHPPEPGDLDRVIAHYCGLARELGPKVGEEVGAEASARLAAESSNLEAMILAALAGDGTTTLGIEAALALVESVRFSGVGSTAALERARLEAHALGDRLNEANCITGLGDIALGRSRHEDARVLQEEALALYRQEGSLRGEADCIRSLGDIALGRWRHEEAHDRYEQAIALYGQAGVGRGRAYCIWRLGDVALARSRYEEARDRFDEALALYREVGWVRGKADCIKSLGDIALACSQPSEARTQFDEALELYRQAGWVRGVAYCVKGRADIALAQSQYEEARARFDEALELYRRVGWVLGEAFCIMGYGDIALAQTQDAEASDRYDDALGLFRRVGWVLGEAHCISRLGDVALACSQPEEARSRFEEALSLYELIAEPYSVGQAHRRLARLAADGSERDSHVRSATDVWASIGRVDLIEALGAEFRES